MHNNTKTTFVKLRTEYRDDEDILRLIKEIFIHSKEEQHCNILEIPGRPDLQKADNVLSALGYRGYSIHYLPKEAYGYYATRVTFGAK